MMHRSSRKMVTSSDEEDIKSILRSSVPAKVKNEVYEGREAGKNESDRDQRSDDDGDQSNLQTDAAFGPISQQCHLSLADQDARLRAFRNRIGVTPHTTSTLLLILCELNWNIDRAEAFFRFQQAKMRSRHQFFDRLSKNDSVDGNEVEPVRLPSQSPDLKLTNEDTLGPKYAGGFTIEEHLENIETSRIELPGKIFDHGLLYNGNADLERRYAVVVFADVVNERFNVLLSRSEAALALGVARWDFESAIDFYQSPQSIHQIRTVLSEYFDRTRVSMSTFESSDDAQSARDQRLAMLLTLTGFTSWYSAQLHLTRNDGDLVKAVASWVKYGINLVRHPQDKVGTRNQGIGRRIDFDGYHVALPNEPEFFRQLVGDDDQQWAEEPEMFMSDETKASVNISNFQKTSTGSWSFPTFGRPKKPINEKQGKLRTRRPGGVINYDVETTKPGAPDWTKLTFEYIQKGKYFSVPYKNNRLLIPDRGENRLVSEGGTRDPNDPRTAVFDWNSKDNIEHLRKSLTQKTTRVTQSSLRDAGQRLSIEEKRFLKHLVDEAYERHHLANPGKSEAELKRGFFVPDTLKQTWSNRWNTRFAGKTVPSESEPRRWRKGQNLYNLVKRWKRLSEMYGMTFDKTGNATDKNEDRWPWEAGGDGENDDTVIEEETEEE